MDAAFASGRESKLPIRQRRRRYPAAEATPEERERLIAERASNEENIDPEDEEGDETRDEYFVDAPDSFARTSTRGRLQAPFALPGSVRSKQEVEIYRDDGGDADNSTELKIILQDADEVRKQKTAHVKTVSRGQQTDNFITPDGTRFCNDCCNARFDPDYSSRFVSLLRRMYCSGCKREHGALQFSATQRRQYSDESRVCIAHEGYMRLCPHRTISSKEIRDWGNSNPESGSLRHIKCQESSCNALFKIEVQQLSTGTEQLLTIEWAMNSFGRHPKPVQKTAGNFLLSQIKDYPGLFCPHVRAHSTGFADPASIRPVVPEHGSFNIECYTCYVHVVFTLYNQRGLEGVSSIAGYRKCHMETINREHRPPYSYDWTWIMQLEPESFNLHSDQESKHVATCDGGEDCATNYRLLRFTEILRDAHNAVPICPSPLSTSRCEGEDLVRKFDRMTASKKKHR
ncbi:hypothetical protein NQ176_g4503 [Zarea fungicola]|uniref:Uncharacterized protein n=1 Tax=Zarea fungicola TaxID=93591 RepID=A0ACC1NE05_9HYPO|nr:hypothetical protein NQ176_g4503 [Lecanicillium fungicola]